MEMLEATYTQFAAVITADTGAGGLSNTTGDQYVRTLLRETNAQAKDGLPPARNRPAVIVAVSAREIGHEASGRSFEAMIRARIETDRDVGVSIEDAIINRMVDQFNGIALASGSTGWTFTTCTFIRPVQGLSEKMLYPVLEFQVIGTK